MRNGIFFATQQTDFFGLLNLQPDEDDDHNRGVFKSRRVDQKLPVQLAAQLAKPLPTMSMPGAIQPSIEELELLDFCQSWNNKISDNYTLLL